RQPSLSNPLAEGLVKAASHVSQGEPGKALWDVTGGMTPAVAGLGRATGVMEPAGTHASSSAPSGSPFAGPASRENPWRGLGGGQKAARPNPWKDLGSQNH